MEEMVYTNENFKKSIKVNTSSVWIGDPCYALTDELYDSIVCQDKWNNCILGDEKNGEFGLVHCTMYGDGAYDSEMGACYGVDAGVLAILAGEFADGDCVDDGTIIEVEEGEHELTLEYTEDGTFYFYIDGEEVDVVPTGDEDDDWDDECEDWDDDEYTDDECD